MADVINAFKEMISDKTFPCVAAKDALNKDNIKFLSAGHIACPKDDERILEFIYNFTRQFRNREKGFHSAVVLFPFTEPLDEKQFEIFLFQRLKALRALDAKNFAHDKRVSEDPQSENFSFSLMQEAFFIIGLHPGSSRPARQFPAPAIVFNPHVQFEDLRKKGLYDKLKAIVRKRDMNFSGSVNTMLADFGDRSEIFQYSGRVYTTEEKCPFSGLSLK
ncbi:YqcI/YcgG family protein [Sphingobacterium sp. SGG-5]|nr:YqcI/YcgG family protein [Sphingobacterium sp. SGG-5]